MARVVELIDERVRDELESLPDDMKALFRRIVELIQAFGLELVRELASHLRYGGRSARRRSASIR